ncbi:MAG: alpha-L-fucosidase [Bacillota bacterium]|nr:alpha-L-fucosidase [Bacillota bacterium]
MATLEGNKKWFKEAKFGMMIHWGLYALPAGEWKGKRMDYIGEWLQSKYRIPINEYSKLADGFNPIFFDAEEWVKLAKDAGMKYIVATSKHHDGFAMYHSEVDKYNVYDATSWKRDFIEELSEACKRHDMKMGIYYSQALDWHDPDGGGYGASKLNYDMSWTNDWDFQNVEEKNYTRCFERKIKPQLKEILTKYGELCLIWFDTPHTISPSQSLELYDMVRKYQPGCLVNSRIGNGIGDYKSMGDNQIARESFIEELAETPATLNDTWGYKSFDNNWKEAEKIAEIKKYLNERGVNYLLNVGPDYLGRIPAPSCDILREVGNITK